MPELLRNFIAESNAIEGILREPFQVELTAFASFMNSKASLDDLCLLQAGFAGHKPLRTVRGMDVQIGSYIAPRGGPEIAAALIDLLSEAQTSSNPWKVHCDFEQLHPFMDGNGRTGRALWAWHMQRLGRKPFALPFLHRFYYQTLENSQ